MSTSDTMTNENSPPPPEFNAVMKDEFDWFDQLRDAIMNEDLSSTHWNVNSLYVADIPADIEERAR